MSTFLRNFQEHKQCDFVKFVNPYVILSYLSHLTLWPLDHADVFFVTSVTLLGGGPVSSWLRSGCLHYKERFMSISEYKFILEMKQIVGNLQHMQFFFLFWQVLQ